MISHNKMFASR